MRVAEARSGVAGHDKSGCVGVFYDKAVKDVEATKIEGRQVFKRVPYVEILIPGCPHQRPNLKATDEHKTRFPAAWQAYQERRTGLVDGTPLNEWTYLDVAKVAELSAAGLLSVEQVANVSDGDLKVLGMHGRELRERAKQFLKGAGEVEKELRSTIEEQGKQIKDLEARIRQLVEGKGIKEAKVA